MTVMRTSCDLLYPKCAARAADNDHSFGMYQLTRNMMDTIVVNRLLIKENHLQGCETEWARVGRYSSYDSGSNPDAYHLSMLYACAFLYCSSVKCSASCGGGVFP